MVTRWDDEGGEEHSAKVEQAAAKAMLDAASPGPKALPVSSSKKVSTMAARWDEGVVCPFLDRACIKQDCRLWRQEDLDTCSLEHLVTLAGWTYSDTEDRLDAAAAEKEATREKRPVVVVIVEPSPPAEPFCPFREPLTKRGRGLEGQPGKLIKTGLCKGEELSL